MHNSCISIEWKPPGEGLHWMKLLSETTGRCPSLDEASHWKPPGEGLHWMKLLTETTGTTGITNRLSIN